MIDMISKVPMTNLAEIKSLNDAIAETTNDIDDIGEASQVRYQLAKVTVSFFNMKITFIFL